MRVFDALTNLLPLGPSQLAKRELRLTQAYRAVFLGQPTQEDQNIVLLDLSDRSGFFKFTAPSPGVSLEFIEGRRSLYAAIYGYLSLSDNELRSLQQAAHETAAYRTRLENFEEGE